ncbi:hypothetical protein HPB47_014670 [Ixodes persulcatus]|uniref:Uncharacterized protein n=1 Tax=Ixodes persulcatus TaxID=34615 RepID=A0AC60QVI4_IXOPE|nr:hypothetical protein HPB47_014670 [Ixodes persulcatus]
MWLGSVVTLLTKHVAPKVQAPPAGLGVPGDATLQTPAFTGFMMQVLKLLHGVKRSQQQLSEQLALIIEGQRRAEGFATEPVGLPRIKSTEELMAFEKELESSMKKRIQLKKCMQTIGGDTPKENTSRILRKMLCHEVGAAFTWYGTKNKRAFSTLQFCQRARSQTGPANVLARARPGPAVKSPSSSQARKKAPYPARGPGQARAFGDKLYEAAISTFKYKGRVAPERPHLPSRLCQVEHLVNVERHGLILVQCRCGGYKGGARAAGCGESGDVPYPPLLAVLDGQALRIVVLVERKLMFLGKLRSRKCELDCFLDEAHFLLPAMLHVHLGHGINLAEATMTHALGNASTPGRFVRMVSRGLWEPAALFDRSVTGQACRRLLKDGAVGKKPLTSEKIDAVIATWVPQGLEILVATSLDSIFFCRLARTRGGADAARLFDYGSYCCVAWCGNNGRTRKKPGIKFFRVP